jgi:hypothetical protein
MISVALTAPWTGRAESVGDTLTVADVNNTSSSAYFSDLVATTTVDSLFCVLVTFSTLDNLLYLVECDFRAWFICFVL